jgi:hypothetical protein
VQASYVGFKWVASHKILDPRLGVSSTTKAGTSEKESTCILSFVHPNVHVFTCSSFMWLGIHASMEEFTWFLYVNTPLVIESHNLFPRGQKDAQNSLLIHAN